METQIQKLKGQLNESSHPQNVIQANKSEIIAVRKMATSLWNKSHGALVKKYEKMIIPKLKKSLIGKEVDTSTGSTDGISLIKDVTDVHLEPYEHGYPELTVTIKLEDGSTGRLEYSMADFL
tara:strand:+ start:1637 stop:2002 length:366 start_codon:yes stop_codon:yes gene_type:complete